MDRTAFDIAFDSPLYGLLCLFEIVKSGIQINVGIVFNSSFWKTACKSIASNFIAGIYSYVKGNVVPSPLGSSNEFHLSSDLKEPDCFMRFG